MSPLLPRESETHPTLHQDEADDLVEILRREAVRTSEALSNAWGADVYEEVEKQGHWLIRIQLLLSALGRSDIARQFSAASIFQQYKVGKKLQQERNHETERD